jgi:hypothetical protein
MDSYYDVFAGEMMEGEIMEGIIFRVEWLDGSLSNLYNLFNVDYGVFSYD